MHIIFIIELYIVSYFCGKGNKCFVCHKQYRRIFLIQTSLLTSPPLIHAQLRAERSAEGVEEGNKAGKVLLVGELEGDFTLSLAVAREGHGGMESG